MDPKDQQPLQQEAPTPETPQPAPPRMSGDIMPQPALAPRPLTLEQSQVISPSPQAQDAPVQPPEQTTRPTEWAGLPPEPAPQTQPNVSQQAPASRTNPPAEKPKKRHTFVWLAIIAVIALFLIAGALVGYLWWKNGQLALKTYTTETYSFFVPETFQKDAQSSSDDVAMFIEPNSTPADRSYVGAGVQLYKQGQTMTDAQFQEFKKVFSESSVKQSLGKVDSSGISVNNATIHVSEGNGTVTYSGTGDMQQKKKTIGQATFMFRFTKNGAEFVVVAANNSDPALRKHTQKIIDSFTVINQSN